MRWKSEARMTEGRTFRIFLCVLRALCGSIEFFVLILAGLSLASCTTLSTKMTKPANDTALFQLNGKPIHPSCLLLLNGELADLLPVSTAVDIEGCIQSNQYGIPFVVEDNWYRISDKSLTGDGYFQYRQLGVGNDGIHIIQIEESGGGSGIFGTLLLVRLQNDRVFESGKWQDRAEIVCCGSCPLGDRDFRSIEVRGDRVIVGKSIEIPETTTIALP
jgi:hypothetical protein